MRARFEEGPAKICIRPEAFATDLLPAAGFRSVGIETRNPKTETRTPCATCNPKPAYLETLN
jgi:hypothetical protein